ncbi:MAG TPA: GAF domain-containing protein [Thermoanaerobaculia bacterium]|nr:GAF domain-containing protein [Thermoanaerobaculia bacterium]
MIQDSQPLALLAGFDSGSVEVCLRLLGPELHLLVADSEAEALRLLASHPVAVLALGAGIPGEKARDLLERAEETRGAARRVHIVLAGGSDLTLFQDLIDRDRIFYLTSEPVPAADVVAILRGAAERWRTRVPIPEGEVPRWDPVEGRLIAAVRTIASRREPAAAARAAAEAVEELTGAERGYCLLYDPAGDVLWSGSEGSSDHRRESAAVGLVSFVTRTGRPVVVERLAGDSRFDREADDPHGMGDERFMAVPLLGQNGQVLAVLAAVRPPEAEPFSEADLRLLGRLAEQASPTFVQLRLLQNEGAPVRLYAEGLFRDKAVEHHQDGLRGEGDLLRADPTWIRWSYRLLLAVVVAGLLFSLLARVREYASGPAVVRLGGRTDVTATSDGTVSDVAVQPGQQVEAGRLLVRFYGAREAADLERIEQELELQLINRLRNPSDTGAERALLTLRAERELARARLAEREVRAPRGGLVSDLRVRPGQRIAPGQVLLSLAGEGGDPVVLALLPGQYRPLLKPGMELRLELQGYRYTYQHLTVTAVENEVIGPTEAKRYLGEEIADAVPLNGPVVLVSARLPSPTFQVEGKTRRFHDGMWAQAEVRVRSERVLVALVPALRALFEEADV